MGADYAQINHFSVLERPSLQTECKAASMKLSSIMSGPGSLLFCYAAKYTRYM